MRKSVRRHRLIGRMFVTVELKPTTPAAPVEGCLYEIEVENTTTVVHDVVVHSKVIEGTPDGLGQNSSEVQHTFMDLLDRSIRKSSVIAWSAANPDVVRAHAVKVSHKCDISTGWTDDLIDPVIETMMER